MKASLAAVGALLAFSACAAGSERPSDPLLAELAMLTGPNAKQCGPVSLGSDPSSAWRCAQDAAQQSTPHWFAVQREGIDSDVWLASMLTPSGQRFILSYDSNFMVVPELLPRFTREACNGTVVFTPGSKAALQCSRSEP